MANYRGNRGREVPRSHRHRDHRRLSQPPTVGYGPAMPLLSTLDLVLLLSLLIVAVSLVPASQLILQIYLGIRRRRLVDATDWAAPPPPAVADLVARLEQSGFSAIGVRAALLSGRRRRFEWALIGRPTTTYISLVPTDTLKGGVLMACHSVFSDGAVVATFFPTGVEICRDGLVAASTDQSPEAAIALHRVTVASLSARHGTPLENRSMGDLLQRDATYRQRHGGATLRHRAYAYVAMASVLAMACGVVIARLVVLDLGH